VRLATIGAEDAIKQSYQLNRRYYAEAGKGALIQKHHAPVIDLGTVRTAVSDPTPLPKSTEGDGLDIPDFLVRR
jgi:hypothetical protein